MDERSAPSASAGYVRLRREPGSWLRGRGLLSCICICVCMLSFVTRLVLGEITSCLSAIICTAKAKARTTCIGIYRHERVASARTSALHTYTRHALTHYGTRNEKKRKRASPRLHTQSASCYDSKISAPAREQGPSSRAKSRPYSRKGARPLSLLVARPIGSDLAAFPTHQQMTLCHSSWFRLRADTVGLDTVYSMSS